MTNPASWNVTTCIQFVWHLMFFQVEFVGEEAEDAGGVKKEFFLLLLKEIFDPVYGMFKQSEETNMIWFSNNPFEDDVMYYLIGKSL